MAFHIHPLFIVDPAEERARAPHGATRGGAQRRGRAGATPCDAGKCGETPGGLRREEEERSGEDHGPRAAATGRERSPSSRSAVAPSDSRSGTARHPAATRPTDQLADRLTG